MTVPLVSVKVFTFNHEKYITKCLEGILMQKTDFPFEIIVGEDCSTDRTREIVIAYQDKYPEIIKPILHPENVGGKQNVLSVYKACQGKYHAICEGDDYWIDPLKLKRQVELMESSPDLSMCFHNAFIHNVETQGTSLFYHEPIGPNISFEEMLKISFPTASLVARSNVLDSLPDWINQITWRDLVVRLWCAHKGSVYFLNDTMSVYRVHNKGATETWRKSPMIFENNIFLHEQIDKETDYKYTHAIQERLVRMQHRNHKNRIWFLLTHPKQIYERLIMYLIAFNRQKSVIHYGHNKITKL